uniref:Uncharacterized protein n=1 Tax=Parastrongyloides trichosuri TaxID=131310 RepID=A0A0N4ZPT4_PARTI
MPLDLISKSLDFVDRDIIKNNSQTIVKNDKKMKKIKKNTNKKLTRNNTLTEARRMLRTSAFECNYDEESGEIVKIKGKRKNNNNVDNIISMKKAKKRGQSLIDQYRNSKEEDNNNSCEDEELDDDNHFEEELDIEDINTVVKFVYEESNNRRKALKSLDRSQHGRKRVPIKEKTGSIFKDSEFEELSKKNTTIVLNSKVKKLTSEEEIKKALGIRR